MIPVSTITKPPSAELRPGQKDSDSLPEYEVLDQILKSYIEEQKSVREIVSEGFDADTVKRVIRWWT
jgi:NAD+ synthase (glutamine-hydrolysing)